MEMTPDQVAFMNALIELEVAAESVFSARYARAGKVVVGERVDRLNKARAELARLYRDKPIA